MITSFKPPVFRLRFLRTMQRPVPICHLLNIAQKDNLPSKKDGFVRLLHFSDIHIGLSPSLRELLFTKRILGYLNHLIRRKHRIHVDFIQSLAQLLPQLQPDAVLCTGDLSSIGISAEFQTAEKLLQPFKKYNLIYVPGNHDRYVIDEKAFDTLHQTFRHCNPDGLQLDALPAIHVVKGVALILLNPACPVTYHLSCGILNTVMQHRVDELLEDIPEETPRAIACHFPPLMPNDTLAGWRHGLRGASFLAAKLKEGKVDAILSGHEHKPFLLKMPRGQLQLCAGSLTLEGSYTICDFPNQPCAAGLYPQS